MLQFFLTVQTSEMDLQQNETNIISLFPETVVHLRQLPGIGKTSLIA